MTALFFPLTREDARTDPKGALKKLRRGGFVAPDKGGIKVPFCRQAMEPAELAVLLHDAKVDGSCLYWHKGDFPGSKRIGELPETVFRRYYRQDNSIFYVGTSSAEAALRL